MGATPYGGITATGVECIQERAKEVAVWCPAQRFLLSQDVLSERRALSASSSQQPRRLAAWASSQRGDDASTVPVSGRNGGAGSDTALMTPIWSLLGNESEIIIKLKK